MGIFTSGQSNHEWGMVAEGLTEQGAIVTAVSGGCRHTRPTWCSADLMSTRTSRPFSSSTYSALPFLTAFLRRFRMYWMSI